MNRDQLTLPRVLLTTATMVLAECYSEGRSRWGDCGKTHFFLQTRTGARRSLVWQGAGPPLKT